MNFLKSHADDTFNIQRMSHNFLIHGDYNVIIVQWGGGAGTPYTQAVGNARLVGLEIAFLIRTLVVS